MVVRSGRSHVERAESGTNAQRNELIKLYLENADLLTTDDYSVRIGIKLDRVKKYLVELLNGESIFSKDHSKRKSRVIPFQTLVTTVLNKDPTTLKDISRTISQSETMRIEGTATENLEEIKDLVMSSSALSRFFRGKTTGTEDRTLPL